jgi:hypothetical protein
MFRPVDQRNVDVFKVFGRRVMNDHGGSARPGTIEASKRQVAMHAAV